MARRYWIWALVLLLALPAGIPQGFSVGKPITRRANAATAPPKRVANSITIINTSGGVINSYPFQFGRPFLQRAIPHAPRVLINGRPVTAQADVKNRYPDGSVEFAVMAAVVPSLPKNTPVTLSFADTTRKDDTPLTQAQMLDPSYNFDAVMTLTPASGTAQTASARQMLSDGNCKPWTSGQIAQTMICADDSAARKYDIGFGDGFHPFRPRFYVTFWPTTGQVFVRAVGENGLTTEQEDLKYHLAMSDGWSADLTGTQATNPKWHWVNSRWTHTFWLGGAPTQEVNIDENLPYLVSTRFLPNLDTSVVVNQPTITQAYADYASIPHDIYDGEWDGGDDPSVGGIGWVNAMGTAGDSNHIGPFPLITSLWLHSPDWRLRYLALNMTDQASAWPMNLRESDPTRIFQRGDAAGTGLGRVISGAGRPALSSAWPQSPDNPIVVGTIGSNPWTADDAHEPSVYYAPYILTGDPWYLDMSYAWAGWEVFEDDPTSPSYVCTTQSSSCSYYRGPTGAYGGLYGYNAARAVGWTLRGRAETAFAAPDGTPEKSYFTYMTNDAIAKWEGGLGINGTAFDGSTEKKWVESTPNPYQWNMNGNDDPTQGKIPPFGNLAALCDATNFCGYAASTSTSWGFIPGQVGSFDSPWMNYYMDYAIGRVIELGWPMKQIQAHYAALPIGLIASSQPWFLTAYEMGVEKYGGGFWPDWATYFSTAADPAYLASLQTNWAGANEGGYATLLAPGLSMMVDQGVPGASAAYAWYTTNGYNLPSTVAFRNSDPRWAIVPRNDKNILPAQPTYTPP